MNAFPLISVIIPAYNAADTIERCVDSCLCQSYENVEIVIVNDGSVDNTRQVIDALEKSDDRVRVIHSENKGVSAARNLGIENASGGLLSFVDADDALEKDALQKLYDILVKTDTDIAVGQLRTVKDNDEGSSIGEEKLQLWNGTQALVELLKDHPSTYSSCGKLYKREAVGKTRFSEGRKIHEDSFFVFELFVKQPRVAVTDDVVYDIYPVPDSAGRAAYSDRALDILYFAREKKRIIEASYPELVELTYNVLIKADLAYLSFCYTRGAKGVSSVEKECIKEIKMYRRYYIPMTAYNNKLFFAVTNHLYYPLKWFYQIKR